MMKANRYLILGSGIAGMAAAEAIRAGDPEGSIRMISAEEGLCFNRPMLIREFALDGSGAALFERQQDWHEQFHIDVRLSTRVEEIDRKGKRVRLDDKTWEPYDKLIYALGAEVAVPPIPGVDREQVHVVRTREDMRRIREAMRTAQHAVVIGGGMLGLEDAWAMKEEKLDVAIIEQKKRVAFGQIDQSAGNLMKKRIERMGVPVYVNAAVEEIGDGFVTFRQSAQVQTAAPADAETAGCPGCEAMRDGASAGCVGCPAQQSDELVTIPADLVILSTGVTPNCKLGAEAGLTVTGRSVNANGTAPGQSRPESDQMPNADTARGSCGACCDGLNAGACWIAVDEHCRTSDPDIYAAGDAAAVNGRNDAIWDEAREMGRVAGTNAAADLTRAEEGKRGTNAGHSDSEPVQTAVETYLFPKAIPAIYTPVTAEHVFTGFDTEVFTLADSSGAGTDGVYIRHADVEIFDYQRERYIRVSLQDGIIAGVLLINAPELAPELMEAYYRGAGEEDARRIVQNWKDSHDVDFKPAAPFVRR